MNNNENILEMKNLKTHFFTDRGTVKAVDGVNLSVKRGKTLGIIGESGCGKSVTAHSILRLIPSPPGQIVDGGIQYQQKDNNIIDLAKLDARGDTIRKIRGNEISMIFQEPMTSFGPQYTIGYQIMEAILIHNPEMAETKAKNKTINLLDQVGIPKAEERIDSYPHEFSGGMLQRAMIAMALSCSPRLLIADEPTTALDVTVEAQILELLEELQDETGMSIIIITHNLAVVSEVADQIAVMYLGREVEFADSDQIIDNPLHPYTKGLWNSIPSLDGELEELKPVKGTVPDPINIPAGCPFADRCPEMMAGVCDQGNPPEKIEVEEGHFVRCFLYSE
ncbi:peptide/nickel transport system ATP-binding protein [Halanaerobium saccharolyticum]|uniref:Peptide/nickel transport system ATP-binding protein n=1 Tax=Halanaerobium saccharolyticum TaxID=43595 RepID=A0A4R6LZL1_9FIRM|nr:ABC transporter ATP-binding protein [Halanaerobium saccharolyticum]TDO94331.1 peptide/nickel transport system ATP-binding protein [Halanaerobium saccharolyticum]